MTNATNLPSAVPVPDWHRDERPETEHRSTLKYAGETVATLKFGAQDLSHKIDAPAGTKFVSVYGSVEFAGSDRWQVHHTYAVTPTGAVAAVVYHYGGWNREEGYYQVSPLSSDEGFDAYLWNRYREACTPSLMSGRGVSDPLLKSYAAPLFAWLAELATEYAASDAHRASLEAARWNEVNRRAASYNEAAATAAAKLADYRDALARAEDG